MIHPRSDAALVPLSPGVLREILRKLRDLNLRACDVAVAGGERVRIDGCASLDAPVESAVRYRLRLATGEERQLCIASGPSGLYLTLDPTTEPIPVEMGADAQGRATARRFGARVHPETSDSRAVERFLRRLVRGAFAPAA